MRHRAIESFNAVLNKDIHCDNQSSSHVFDKQLFSTIEFTRAIHATVFNPAHPFPRQLFFGYYSKPEKKKLFPDFPAYNQSFKLLQFVVKKIFTDIYNVGRCQEMTEFGMLHLLKKVINRKIELITLKGEGRIKDHTFLAIDRQSDKPITISSLGFEHFIRFDPWANELDVHDEDNKVSLDTLKVGALASISDISIQWCLNRTLTKVDCDYIIYSLAQLKIFITRDLLIKIASMEGRKINADKEVFAIHGQIDQEIKSFVNLMKSPPSYTPSYASSQNTSSVVALIAKQYGESVKYSDKPDPAIDALLQLGSPASTRDGFFYHTELREMVDTLPKGLDPKMG